MWKQPGGAVCKKKEEERKTGGGRTEGEKERGLENRADGVEEGGKSEDKDQNHKWSQREREEPLTTGL